MISVDLFDCNWKRDDFGDIKKTGFSDYLIKPIYPDVLIETLENVLCKNA